MQWSIYPYAVKYLSLLLPIIVVKYSSLCSEVFTPMQLSIYPYAVKYLSICSEVFTPMWRLEEGIIY